MHLDVYFFFLLIFARDYFVIYFCEIILILEFLENEECVNGLFVRADQLGNMDDLIAEIILTVNYYKMSPVFFCNV